MIRRLFHAFEAVSGLPRKVMLWGLVPSLLLMIAAASICLAPRVSYEKFILSQRICETAVSLFSEGIILGLFIDILQKKR